MSMKATSLIIAGLIVALLTASPVTAAQKTGKTADRSQMVSLLKKGLADLNRRDFDAAIKKFTKANELSPDCRALFLLGLTHYERAPMATTPTPPTRRRLRRPPTPTPRPWPSSPA